MKTFPDFEWPQEEAIQGLLTELLIAEVRPARRESHPGYADIAKALATGQPVSTTPSAADIWHGGLGSFIEVNRKPDKGVGIIQMQMEMQVWKSQHILAKLELLQEQTSAAAEEARLRDDKVTSALMFVKDQMS